VASVKEHLKAAAKNSAIYSLGPLSSKVAGFVLLPLYTSHLTLSEYGILGIVDVTMQIFVSVFGFGLNWAFNRWYWDKEYIHKQKIIFFSLFVFLAATSLVMFALFLPFTNALSILLFDSEKYGYVFKLMLIASGLQILANLPNTLLKLQQRPLLFSVSNTVKLVFSLTFTVIFIVEFNRGIQGIYEALIIGFVVYFVMLSRYIYKNLEFKFDSAVIKEMLIFSLPLMGSSTATVVLSFADRYILKFIGGLNDVGIYSLGYKLSNTIKVFIIQSVILAISPIIYKVMYDENSGEFYSRLMTYFAFVLMIVVVGVSLFGKELVMVLAKNKDYWDAYKIIPILSLAMLFIGIRYIAEIGLNIEKKTGVKAKIVVAVSVLNIILNVVFIPVWQSMGAALAMLVSQAVYFYLNYYFSQKHYFIPFEMKRLNLILFVTTLYIVGALLLNAQFSIGRFIIKAGMFVSIPALLYFLRFFRRDELKSLQKMLKQKS